MLVTPWYCISLSFPIDSGIWGALQDRIRRPMCHFLDSFHSHSNPTPAFVTFPMLGQVAVAIVTALCPQPHRQAVLSENGESFWKWIQTFQPLIYTPHLVTWWLCPPQSGTLWSVHNGQLEGSKMASGRKMTEGSYSLEAEKESLKKKKYMLLQGEFPEFRLKFLCDTVLLTPTQCCLHIPASPGWEAL